MTPGPRDAERAGDPGAGADDPPPFLGSWRNVYLLLLGELGLLVIAFHLLRRWAS